MDRPPFKKLDEKVVELESVPETEQAYTMSGDENRPRLNYYLAWARTYLRHGNALVNSARGVWALTESGVSIKTLDETNMIYSQVTKEQRGRVRANRKAAKPQKTDIVEPADEHAERVKDWRSTLLTLLGVMKPDAFEP